MILDAIFGLFEAAVNGVLGLLPVVEAPDLSSWVGNLGQLWTYAGWLNKYVPLDQAALMLGIATGAFAVTYGIRFVIWVLTKAHVLGGSS